VKYRLNSMVATLLLLGAATAAFAAQQILTDGKPYSFTGYLVTRMGGDSALHVYLSQDPSGDAVSRRDEIIVVNGKFKPNLLKLARANAGQKVLAQGVAKDNQLAVTFVGPEDKAPVFKEAKAEEAMKKRIADLSADALARYRKRKLKTYDFFVHAVKSAALVPKTKHINVVCDLKGGFAGWNSREVHYLYDEKDNLISETDQAWQ
jgi:hypothetical protein